MMLEGLLVLNLVAIQYNYITMIIGGITTGALSDVINARAISCVIMMYCAVPAVRNFLNDL